MAAGTAAQTTTGEEAAMQAVAAAMRDAAATASDHAAKVKESASEAGNTALESISRMVYTGSYVLAYGVVYATVFVARSLPQENPIMRGFRDGGRAAIGELDAGEALEVEPALVAVKAPPRQLTGRLTRV